MSFGLIDFAAHITVQWVLVGTILGGQILFDEPKETEFKNTANELGLNQDRYYNAATEIKVVHESNIKSAAEVLFTVCSYLSMHMYDKYI